MLYCCASVTAALEFKWPFLQCALLWWQSWLSARLHLAMLTSVLLCRFTHTGVPGLFIYIYTHIFIYLYIALGCQIYVNSFHVGIQQKHFSFRWPMRLQPPEVKAVCCLFCALALHWFLCCPCGVWHC